MASCEGNMETMQSVHSEASSSSFQDAIDTIDCTDGSKPTCDEQLPVIGQDCDVLSFTDEKIADKAYEVELNSLKVGENVAEVHSLQYAIISSDEQSSHEHLIVVDKSSATCDVSGNLADSLRTQESCSCVLGFLSVNDNAKGDDEQMNGAVGDFLLLSAIDDDDVDEGEENRKPTSIDSAETLPSECIKTESLSGQASHLLTRWFSFGRRAMPVSTSYLGDTGYIKLASINADAVNIKSTESSALQSTLLKTFPRNFGQDGEDAKLLNFEEDASFVDDACFGDVEDKKPAIKADCGLEFKSRNVGNLDSFEWVDGVEESEADNPGMEGQGENSSSEFSSYLTNIDQVSSDTTWQWWPWRKSTNVSRASDILVGPVETNDHTALLSKVSLDRVEQGSSVSDSPASGTEEVYSSDVGSSFVMAPILVSHVTERNLEVSAAGGGGAVCHIEELSGEEYESSGDIMSSTIANVFSFGDPEAVQRDCCEILSTLNQVSTLGDTESRAESPYKLEDYEIVTPLPHSNNGLCTYVSTTVVPQEDFPISSTLNVFCTEFAEMNVRTGGCTTPSIEEGELKKQTGVDQDEIGSGIGVSPHIEFGEIQEQIEELDKGTELSDEKKEQIEELFKGTELSDEKEEQIEELRKGTELSDEKEEQIEELYKGTEVNLESDSNCQSTISQQHYSQGLEDENHAMDCAVSGNSRQLDKEIAREWNLLEDKTTAVSLLLQSVESNELSYDQCVSDGSNQFVWNSEMTVAPFDAIADVEPGVSIENGLNVVVNPVKQVGDRNLHNLVEESSTIDDLAIKLPEHGQSEIENMATGEEKKNASGLEDKLVEHYSVEPQHLSIMKNDEFLSSESVNGSTSNAVYNVEAGIPTCEILEELNFGHGVNKAVERKTVDGMKEVGGMLCQMVLGDSLNVDRILPTDGWDLLDEIRSSKEYVEKENINVCKVQEESQLKLSCELSKGFDHASEGDLLVESGTLNIIKEEICPHLDCSKASSSNLDDIDDVFNEPSPEEYGHLIGKEAFTPILCDCQGSHILRGGGTFILKQTLGNLGCQSSLHFTGPAFQASIPDLGMDISSSSMTSCILGEAPSRTSGRSWLYFLHLPSSSFLQAYPLAFLSSNYGREIAPIALHWLASPQQIDSHESEPLEVFDRGSLVDDKWLNKTVVMSALIGATAGGVVTVPLMWSIAGLEIGSYTAAAVGVLAGAGLASSLAATLKHTSAKKTSDSRRLQVPGTDTDEPDHFDEGDSFFMVEKEDLEEAVLHRFFEPPVPLSSLPEWAPPPNFGCTLLSEEGRNFA